MARLAAILKALWRAFQRGEKSFASLAGNNFFLMAVLFLGKAGTFLFLIMGLVMLFPLSTDPLRKIPQSRLALVAARKARDAGCCGPSARGSIPMTWVIAALALWAARGSVTAGLWALAAGLFARGLSALGAASAIAGPAMWRRIPHFPGAAGSTHPQEPARNALHTGFLLRPVAESLGRPFTGSPDRRCRRRPSWR